MLVVAVPADDVGPLVGHLVPKEGRGRLEPLLARQLVLPGRAHELGDLGVGVQAGEAVFAIQGRPDDLHVIEPPGDGQILRLAGQAVKVGQRFVHAAVLVAHHGLHLRVAELAVAGDDPIAELLADLQGLLVAAIDIDVLQAGKNLVQRIVRRPDVLDRLGAVDERLGKRASGSRCPVWPDTRPVRRRWLRPSASTAHRRCWHTSTHRR